MSTRTLLSKCYAQISALNLKNRWTRNTGSLSILKLIEKGQDELLNSAIQSQIWRGTGNQGYPPYLTTQNNVYRYEITPDNLTGVTDLTVNIGGANRVVRAKQVLRVFVDAAGISNSDYGITRLNQAAPYHYGSSEGTTRRLSVYKVPVESYEATENSVACIDFQINPGDSTQKYFVEFAWEAPRLSSEDIALVIPENFEEAIYDYVMGVVLESPPDGGSMTKFSQKFEQVWKQKYKSHKNYNNARSSNTQVIRRFC